jgi:hypothetical protein
MRGCGRECSRSGRTESYVQIGVHGGLYARLDAVRSDQPARPVQPTFGLRESFLQRVGKRAERSFCSQNQHLRQ